MYLDINSFQLSGLSVIFLPSFPSFSVVAQSLSHAQLFETYSMPGFLVLHYLPEFAQTHVF